MKRFLLVVVVIAVGAFSAGGWYSTKKVVDDYRAMALENFATALVLFKDGYNSKRIVIFGESAGYLRFEISDYEFVVIPSSNTTSAMAKNSFNPKVGNMASHANEMAVMLACKWLEDGNANGEQLLERLKETIPNFRLSAPNIKTVAIKDLQAGSEMTKLQSAQWNWRMSGEINWIKSL